MILQKCSWLNSIFKPRWIFQITVSKKILLISCQIAAPGFPNQDGWSNTTKWVRKFQISASKTAKGLYPIWWQYRDKKHRWQRRKVWYTACSSHHYKGNDIECNGGNPCWLIWILIRNMASMYIETYTWATFHIGDSTSNPFGYIYSRMKFVCPSTYVWSTKSNEIG